MQAATESNSNSCATHRDNSPLIEARLLGTVPEIDVSESSLQSRIAATISTTYCGHAMQAATQSNSNSCATHGENIAKSQPVKRAMQGRLALSQVGRWCIHPIHDAHRRTREPVPVTNWSCFIPPVSTDRSSTAYTTTTNAQCPIHSHAHVFGCTCSLKEVA
jgi:hypothetical protein